MTRSKDASSAERPTIALMVCTKDRPTALRALLGAVARSSLPDGQRLRTIVTDNSAKGDRDAIFAIAADAGVAIEYAHEPVRGYASVRNRALDTALSAPADLMVFIDDDMVPRPDMLVRYAEVFAETGADVVAGLSHQKAGGYREGQRLTKSTTQNVAFVRRLVEPPPHGLGLRFDPRLDRLGGEDYDFFTRATASGARIIASRRPAAVEQPLEALPDDQRPAPGEARLARMTRARMDGRNDTVAARLRGGRSAAFFQLVRRYPPMLRRIADHSLRSLAIGLVGKARRAEHRETAVALFTQVRGAVEGLHLDGLDRPEAKRGRLVPAGVIPVRSNHDFRVEPDPTPEPSCTLPQPVIDTRERP